MMQAFVVLFVFGIRIPLAAMLKFVLHVGWSTKTNSAFVRGCHGNNTIISQWGLAAMTLTLVTDDVFAGQWWGGELHPCVSSCVVSVLGMRQFVDI